MQLELHLTSEDKIIGTIRTSLRHILDIWRLYLKKISKKTNKQNFHFLNCRETFKTFNRMKLIFKDFYTGIPLC